MHAVLWDQGRVLHCWCCPNSCIPFLQSPEDSDVPPWALPVQQDIMSPCAGSAPAQRASALNDAEIRDVCAMS